MTEGEICREYRLAKDKEKQIGIMADQISGMDREGVIKILVKHGEMKAPQKPVSVIVPKAVSTILLARVDELEKQMAPLEKQIAPLAKEHEEIIAFLRICGEEQEEHEQSGNNKVSRRTACK